MKLIYLVIILILFVACDDTNIDLESKNIPDKDVSFSKHLLPVFYSKCSIVACHDNASQAGGIILDSYFNVTQPNLLVRGNPEVSLLVLVVEGRRLPLAHTSSRAAPFNKKQIEGLITWIKEGAKDN